MSGPWEDYQSPGGPWSDYAKPAKPAPKPAPYTIKGEIQGSYNRLMGDMKTAYTGDKTSGRGNPGGERAAAADRIGSDAVNLLLSPITGAVNKYVNKPLANALGIPEQDIQAVEMAGMMALGARPIGVPRIARPAPRPPAEVRMVMKGQNVPAVQQRAAEYRAAGIQPTLTDVVDDSARGTIRAAASRQTPGRQEATNFRDNRAMDLPSRMSAQARRNMSADPRTPDQIREATAATRRQNADQAFGAVRNDPVQMAPETVQALRTPHGRDAIAEAARRERDPEVRSALNRLATDALDAPNTPITVGMADRISRTLYGRAQAAARAGDNDLAATFSQLGDAVRNPVRTNSAGYQNALEGYAADSRLVDAATTGEGLMTRNTDEFVQAAGAMSPEERALALAAGRRAIERKSGENISAAPGIARQLADAPEQQARNRALMGENRANRFQTGMRLEERALRNANDIAPRGGSQTQPREQDAANFVQGAARLGGQVMRHDWLGVGMDWLRSRGMNDALAEQIVRLSTDPARLDQAIAAVARTQGPQAAQQFIDLRRQVLGAAGAVTYAQPAPQPQNALAPR